MLHAAFGAFSLKACAASGRWETASTEARRGSTSAAKTDGNLSIWTVMSVPGEGEPSIGKGV